MANDVLVRYRSFDESISPPRRRNKWYLQAGLAGEGDRRDERV